MRKNYMSLQGLESIAIHGRFGDTTVGHLSAGEMVLPKPIAHDPVLRRALFDAFQRHDTDPNRYTVGHYENSINPLTGVPEFGWFKDTLKKIAPTVGRVIGFAIGGPAGAAIGGSVGTAAAGGNRQDILKSAATSYIGGNVAQGMGVQGGTFGETTLSEGLGSLNPFGDSFMLSKGQMAGPTQSTTGGIGGFFQDVGAAGGNALGMSGTGTGTAEGFKLGDSYKNLSTLGKVGVGATALAAMGGFEEQGGDARMPPPSGELDGYLQNPLRPATDSGQYGIQGSRTGSGFDETSRLPSSSIASLDPSTAAFFRAMEKDDDQSYTDLMFPQFERLRANQGGGIDMNELDLRQTGGGIQDLQGSGDKDTVNAKLADGEFVLTKQSVKGIGDGNHDKGIEMLYDFMNFNEDKAMDMGLGRA